MADTAGDLLAADAISDSLTKFSNLPPPFSPRLGALPPSKLRLVRRLTRFFAVVKIGTSFGLVRHQPLRLVVKTSGFGIAPPSA